MVWPPLTYFNLFYVPMKFRFLFFNGVSFFWDMLLCYILYRWEIDGIQEWLTIYINIFFKESFRKGCSIIWTLHKEVLVVFEEGNTLKVFLESPERLFKLGLLRAEFSLSSFLSFLIIIYFPSYALAFLWDALWPAVRFKEALLFSSIYVIISLKSTICELKLEWIVNFCSMLR